MPTTRRKATGTPGARSKAKATANQAKLTFHGRVSKPGAAPDTAEQKAAALKAGHSIEEFEIENLGPDKKESAPGMARSAAE